MNESTKIKVLLVDDHSVVLEGLRRILGLDPDIEVVNVATNGSEAIVMATHISPDVIVMDLKMPVMDGVAATRELKQKFPSVRVLMLTMCGEDLVEKAMEAGASGYLQKDSAPKEIANAVHQVYQGLCPISASLTRGLVSELAGLRKKGQALLLTARENEVLKLIAEGKNTSEIGDQLYISLSTVKREVGQIFDKLGVNDRAHAVSEAIRQKLIS
jgi:DNA-binding NarL/FixJ family response regulator